jgi:GDP-L-fucose synthase
MLSLNDKKILVTGGVGFLGTRIIEHLIAHGARKENIIVPRSREYDLRRQDACEKVAQGMDIVIHAAATVGGIGFNKEHPGTAFYDNAAMALNIVDASYRAGVKKFVGIGTVCSYPKFAPIPFREDDVWNGYPEETNAPYGLAKKIMLTEGQVYRQEYGFNAVHLLMVNLYGPGDNFDPASSHVIPALIKKIAEAKQTNALYMEAWGTGSPTREFLYVEDAAEGIVLATEKYDKPEPVNLGSGMEISIKALAELICRLMDYQGEVRWDTTKPDGQPRRALDVSRAEREFGFRATTSFEEGLKQVVAMYQKNI